MVDAEEVDFNEDIQNYDNIGFEEIDMENFVNFFNFYLFWSKFIKFSVRNLFVFSMS